jgi:hypothetical protein
MQKKEILGSLSVFAKRKSMLLLIDQISEIYEFPFLICICGRHEMYISLWKRNGDALLCKGLKDGVHDLMRGKTFVPRVLYPAQKLEVD